MDDRCAACRTDTGVAHECPMCDFSFCEEHSAPEDHRCPELDGDGAVPDEATSGERGSNRDDATGERGVAGAAGPNEQRPATGAVPGSIDGGPLQRAETRTRSAAQRLSTVTSRTFDRTRSTVTDTRSGSGGTRRAVLGLVLVVLVASSAVAVGTSGGPIDAITGGDASSGTTNELVPDGDDEAGSQQLVTATVEDAVLERIGAARENVGAPELAPDPGLRSIAANHSEEMAERESADLDGWDGDRLVDRLAAADHACETAGRTGAWIDPGDETDEDALAATAVDRWLEDDGFGSFLRSADHDLAAIASAEGDDGRLYVSVTVCGR